MISQFVHKPSLSDHLLVTLEFLLQVYNHLMKETYSRILSDSAIAKFKELNPSVINWVLCLN